MQSRRLLSGYRKIQDTRCKIYQVFEAYATLELEINLICGRYRYLYYNNFRMVQRVIYYKDFLFKSYVLNIYVTLEKAASYFEIIVQSYLHDAIT